MILPTAFIVILVQATAAEVSLINNGYSTVVVAIRHDVSEDQSLLDAIEREFRAASSYLYRATKNRAYFKDITIVVPHTWPDRNEYGKAVSENFDNADIQIEIASRDTAYVRRSRTCGVTDGRMHVTPNRIKGLGTRFQFSPPSRMLVHEWGHLRWGVFDEYATKDTSKAYVANTGQVAGTTCSVQLANTGSVLDSNGRPCSPSNVRLCRYYYPSSTNSRSSIMSAQFLPSVDSFCTSSGHDGVRHNIEAPNNQNMRCRYRSTWDVIMSHPDFRSGANPPRSSFMNTVPSIKIVRQTLDESYVLVLDISGSMKGDKIVQLRQAARRFIESASEGAQIGIVVFNSAATVRTDLFTITTSADRQTLVNNLPGIYDPTGGTGIGRGLQRGVAVLAGQTTVGWYTDVGGKIVLVTDGEETDAPFIESVIPQLVSARVRVYPIGIGSAASSKLSRLATATGGNFFFINSKEAGLSDTALLYEALLTIADSGSALGTLQLLSTSVDVPPTSNRSGKFRIDSGAVLNTTVSFSWTTGNIPYVNVTSPSGIVSTNDGAVLTSSFNTLEFYLRGTAEVGEWTYIINNLDHSEQTVTIGVTSQPSSRNAVVLTAKFSDQNVYFPDVTIISAELKAGDKFVTGAKVTALISRPNSFPVTVNLYDNGIDPDSDRDDGLYSAFFTQYIGNGRYNAIVKAEATTNEAKAVEYVPISDIVPDDQSSDTNDPSSESQPLEAFMRSTSAGVMTLQYFRTEDLIPPARIADLAATGSSYVNRSVTLQWTAAGDDAFTGNATYCNLSLANSFYDLINATAFNMQKMVTGSDVLAGSLDPLPGGSAQNVTVKVAGAVADKPYYAALRCTDDADNPSEVSNIEQFIFVSVTASGHSTSGQKITWMTLMVVLLADIFM